jgi:hypothetical protein
MDIAKKKRNAPHLEIPLRLMRTASFWMSTFRRSMMGDKHAKKNGGMWSNFSIRLLRSSSTGNKKSTVLASFAHELPAFSIWVHM